MQTEDEEAVSTLRDKRIWIRCTTQEGEKHWLGAISRSTLNRSRGIDKMRSTLGVMFVGSVLVLLSFWSYAENNATLVAAPKILLAEEGDGPWGLTVQRDHQGDGAGPSGSIAVDNSGRIYVCDTFGDKILVYTDDGQPHAVLTDETLSTPLKVTVDENDVLHVDAMTEYIPGDPETLQPPKVPEAVQHTITRDVKGWTFAEKQKAEMAPNAAHNGLRVGMTAPLGRDGLKYLVATDGYRYPLQLVDADNHFVKFVPCKEYDKTGRYYKRRFDPDLDQYVVSVLDESGRLLGEFLKPRDSILGPIMYRGWVYYIEPEDGKWCMLCRFAQDGSVEHEIELVGIERKMDHPEPPFAVSPDSEYCFVYDWGGQPGHTQLWVQRLTYRETE